MKHTTIAFLIALHGISILCMQNNKHIKGFTYRIRTTDLEEDDYPGAICKQYAYLHAMRHVQKKFHPEILCLPLPVSQEAFELCNAGLAAYQHDLTSHAQLSFKTFYNNLNIDQQNLFLEAAHRLSHPILIAKLVDELLPEEIIHSKINCYFETVEDVQNMRAKQIRSNVIDNTFETTISPVDKYSIEEINFPKKGYSLFCHPCLQAKEEEEFTQRCTGFPLPLFPDIPVKQAIQTPDEKYLAVQTDAPLRERLISPLITQQPKIYCIMLRDLQNKKSTELLCQTLGATPPLYCFAPTSTALATISHVHTPKFPISTLNVYDIESKKRTFQYTRHLGIPTVLKFNNAGTKMLSVSVTNDSINMVNLWNTEDLTNIKPIQSRTCLPYAIRDAFFNATDDCILATTHNGEFVMIDGVKGTVLAEQSGKILMLDGVDNRSIENKFSLPNDSLFKGSMYPVFSCCNNFFVTTTQSDDDSPIQNNRIELWDRQNCLHLATLMDIDTHYGKPVSIGITSDHQKVIALCCDQKQETFHVIQTKLFNDEACQLYNSLLSKTIPLTDLYMHYCKNTAAKNILSKAPANETTSLHRQLENDGSTRQNTCILL